MAATTGASGVWQPPEAAWDEGVARRVLAEIARTGESGSAFMRRHGLGPARLVWWRRKLALQARAAEPARSGPSSSEARMHKESAAAIPFALVQHRAGRELAVAGGTAPAGAPVIEIVLCNGRQLRVTGMASMQQVAALVVALEGSVGC